MALNLTFKRTEKYEGNNLVPRVSLLPVAKKAGDHSLGSIKITC